MQAEQKKKNCNNVALCLYALNDGEMKIMDLLGKIVQ